MASVSPVEESSAHSVGTGPEEEGEEEEEEEEECETGILSGTMEGDVVVGGGEEEEDEEEEGEEEEDDDEEDEDEEEEEEDEVDEDEESEASQMPTRLKTPCSSPKRSVSPRILEEDMDRMLPTPVRKRGRPSKADVLKRQAAGESEEVATPKKRGRKPMPKEEKERLKEEKKEKRRLELLEKRKSSGEPRKKPGRKSLALTAEEKEKREKARKAKYEEFKKAKAEKAAKRAERNEQLRLIRKQKKEEEARQREAYEKRMQELKASFLDENTQMSSGGGIGDFVEGLQDETSQSSMSSFKKGFINEMSYMDRMRNVTAETLLEYRWPLEGKNSEYYFLQDQVCEYLGIKSFKRKYPDVTRRKIDFEERDFLVEMKIVSEMQADLGLTAITSSEVLDIMSRDFYDKYDEYMNVISERKDRNIKQTSYNTVTVEKHHLADFVEKAVQSTAEWNKNMNKERFENRKAYFDLQTFSIHYPMNNRGRMKVIPKPKLGHYPISIIPGQFTDYFRKYTSSQLKYMPLNSTLAGPPQSGTRIDFVDSPPELDISESSSCSTCSDSSSSDSENEVSQEEEEKSPLPPSLNKNGKLI
uniref:Nucleolar protein 12 n=1 Tax=Lepeophtheirus salmonis TaxID=72036 RepID=A0A0K2UQH7_LEPSM